jgi:molecular chaperone GrpE
MSDQQGRPEVPTDEAVAETVVGVREDPTSPAPDDAPAVPVDGASGDGEAGSDGDEANEAAADEQPDWEALSQTDPRSRGELLAELTEAEARRDEYLEDVRRARAEFENYRKRVMREGSTQRELGKSDVAARILEVLDDFDRTVDAADNSSDEGLAKGVALVHGNLVTALRDLGLARIDAIDVIFDPNRHEAVQQLPADEPLEEPVVAEVFRPGYEMGGRVLRAAMVVVRQ